MKKMLTVTFAVICLTLSCVGCASQLSAGLPKDVGMSPEKLERVRPAVQALVREEKIVGATVVIARKGRIVLFENFGMMDREAGKSMKSDTIYRIYSMTKPITSVAIMMLYEQGKLDLDDPVSEYIPAFKGLKVYAESGEHKEQIREMTIRDLLRHTSGLTYGIFGDTPVDMLYRDANILDWQSPLETMMDKLSQIPLLHQPGTKWHYSVSTDVLGHLVEVVSGQSLNLFFHQEIFKPLGMKDSDFHVPRKKIDRFAVCYGPTAAGSLYVTDNPVESQYLEKPVLLSGGGGLVSTAEDYLRFCQMLLNKGQLDGNQLLRPETVDMMTSDQLPKGVTRGPGEGFGLGFSVQTKDGKRPRGEYGWGGIASTHFWISPKDELIVVALSQRMPYSSQLEDAVRPVVYEAIVDGE